MFQVQTPDLLILDEPLAGLGMKLNLMPFVFIKLFLILSLMKYDIQITQNC